MGSENNMSLNRRVLADGGEDATFCLNTHAHVSLFPDGVMLITYISFVSKFHLDYVDGPRISTL